MNYQSLEFLIFAGLFLIIYYLVGRKRQLWVLVVANFLFYAAAGEKQLAFIFTTMITTFWVGKKISAIYEKSDERILTCTTPAEKKEVRAEAKKKAKKYLLLGIFVTLALLVVCKYTFFILETLCSIVEFVNIPKLDSLKIILPLGISFYSFMALSYVLDIYWKRYKAEKDFLTYAVYLTYFPHIVQGPIDRFKDFKDQIKEGVSFEYKNITFGAQLVIWGLFKKLVIADRLHLFVDLIFEDWFSSDGVLLVLAIAAYSIQIYADFSGCIDIVTGISEMFGIKIRKNFNHPYFSRNMAEFWRRWHMSLNEWFKDYIYYPVSASGFMKKGKKFFKEKNNLRAMELFASCFPVLVVWLITGIWHGADWKFVVWGIYHAILLIGSQILAPVFQKCNNVLKVDTDNFGWHFIQMCRTFILCSIGRVFFRADNMKHATWIFRKIKMQFSFGALFAEDVSFGMDMPNVVVAIFAIMILWCIDMLQEKMSIRETLAKQNIFFRWMIILAGIFVVIIFGLHGPGFEASNFIYEQF